MKLEFAPLAGFRLHSHEVAYGSGSGQQVGHLNLIAPTEPSIPSVFSIVRNGSGMINNQLDTNHFVTFPLF